MKSNEAQLAKFLLKLVVSAIVVFAFMPPATSLLEFLIKSLVAVLGVIVFDIYLAFKRFRVLSNIKKRQHEQLYEELEFDREIIESYGKKDYRHYKENKYKGEFVQIFCSSSTGNLREKSLLDYGFDHCPAYLREKYRPLIATCTLTLTGANWRTLRDIHKYNPLQDYED